MTDHLLEQDDASTPAVRQAEIIWIFYALHIVHLNNMDYHALAYY
ncbi:MAG: hypothetical protein OQL11_03365 [Gammaproteobacteria bacterium]|nr:hypothetical protein [Gammaproteobacteria bacterium]